SGAATRGGVATELRGALARSLAPAAANAAASRAARAGQPAARTTRRPLPHRGDAPGASGAGMNVAALSPAASPPAPFEAARLQRLPLVTLYLTERCNSRCVTCDYWRYGADDLSLQGLQQLLPELRRLHTEVALFSGGEPL